MLSDDGEEVYAEIIPLILFNQTGRNERKQKKSQQKEALGLGHDRSDEGGAIEEWQSELLSSH